MKKGIENTTMKNTVIVLLIVNKVIAPSKTVCFMKVVSISSSRFSLVFKTFRLTFENLLYQVTDMIVTGDSVDLVFLPL